MTGNPEVSAQLPFARVGQVNGLSTHLGVGEILPIRCLVKPVGRKGTYRVNNSVIGSLSTESSINTALNCVHFTLSKDYSFEFDRDKTDILFDFPGPYKILQGDSAGLALTIALFSTITSIPVLDNIAITGAIQADGKVNAVGGVSVKVEAVPWSGRNWVLIPQENYIDYQNINYIIRNSMNIVLVSNIHQALFYALGPYGPRGEEYSQMLYQFNQAIELCRMRDPQYASALRIFAELRQKYPENLTLSIWVNYIAEIQGNKIYQECLSKAQYALDKKNYLQAIRACKEGLVYRPSDGGLLFIMDEATRQIGRQKALPYYNKGMALLNKKQYKAAIPLLSMAARLCDDDEFLTAQYRAEAEIKLVPLREILRKDPDRIDYLRQIAETYRDGLLFDESAQYYQKILSLPGAIPSDYIQLAQVAVMSRNSESAIATLRRALQANPSSPDIQKALLRLKVDLFPPAIESTLSDQAVIKDSTEYQVRASDVGGIQRIEIYRDGQKWQETHADALSFVLDPFDLAEGNHAIEIRAEDKKGNLARKTLAVSVRLGNPADYEQLYLQSQTALRKGQYEKALAAARRVVRLQPDRLEGLRACIQAAVILQNGIYRQWAEQLRQKHPENPAAMWPYLQTLVADALGATDRDAYQKGLQSFRDSLTIVRGMETKAGGDPMETAYQGYLKRDDKTSIDLARQEWNRSKKPSAWFLYHLARLRAGQGIKVRVEASRESGAAPQDLRIPGQIISGLCYLENGESQAAQRIYDDLLPALQDGPLETAALVRALSGSALLANGQMIQADEAFRTALETNALSAISHYYRAASLWNLSASGFKIKEALRMALILDPLFAEAWADVGLFYVESGQPDWALPALDVARFLAPASLYVAAVDVVIENLTDLQKARELYRMRLSDNQNPYHHLVGAFLATKANESESLREHLNWLSQHYPGIPGSEVAKGDLKGLMRILVRIQPPYFDPRQIETPSTN